MDHRVWLGNLDHQDHQETGVHQVFQVQQELKEQEELKVPKESVERLEYQERKVLWDHLVFLGHQVLLDLVVCVEKRDRLVNLVVLALQGEQVTRDHQEVLAPWDHQVDQDCL